MSRKHFNNSNLKNSKVAHSDNDDSKVFIVHEKRNNYSSRTYSATIFGRRVTGLTKEEYECINGPLFID